MVAFDDRKILFAGVSQNDINAMQAGRANIHPWLDWQHLYKQGITEKKRSEHAEL